MRHAALFLGVLLTGTLAAADDLSSLAQEYREAMKGISGNPDQRLEKARKQAGPVLEKIGRLDSAESLAFLVNEFRTARPELAAVAAKPLLASSEPRVVELALADFPRRPPVVQEAVLNALATSKKDLSKIEDEIVRLASQRLRPGTKAALPPVLGKLDTPRAAAALLRLVASTRGRSGEEEGKLRKQVVEALGTTKSTAVKSWLSGEAFRVAGSDPERQRVLLEVVGRLELAGAREEVLRRIGDRSPEVSGAAIEALTRVGIGDAVGELARILEQRGGKADPQFLLQVTDALVKSGDRRALETVMGLAQQDDPQLKVIALGSLGLIARKNDKALEILLGGLDDPDDTVKAVTLRAVSQVRDKAVIGPLIETLATSENYSFRVKVLELLVSLTNQNMGLVAEDWRKWWEIAEPRFEFPKEKDDSLTAVRQTYDLDYFGIEVSSKQLTFVCDISSSMNQEVTVKRRDDDDEGRRRGGRGGRTVTSGGGSGEDGKDGGGKTKARKIEVLKRELVRVLGKLPADAHVNIITFDAEFAPWQKHLQPMSGSGRGRAIRFARSINTGHGTNVYDTLEFALQDQRVDTIYLLTDGLPSRGRYTDPEAILREIGKINRLRAATIHCIAFGEESKFLEKLAGANGGKYRFVDEY